MGSFIKYQELTKQQILSLDPIISTASQSEMEGLVDALVWCDDVTVWRALHGEYHIYRIVPNGRLG